MAQLQVKNMWYVLRTSWFMPESWYTTMVFLILVSFMFILIIFFHHSSVQRYVKKHSRCYKNKVKKSASGVYMVTATDGQKNPLYTVSYDLAKKENKLECACPEGTVTNAFRDIKVYNLRTKSTDTIKDKYCNCNFAGDAPSTSVYFTGHPGLVRFMNSGDDSFFTA